MVSTRTPFTRAERSGAPSAATFAAPADQPRHTLSVTPRSHRLAGAVASFAVVVFVFVAVLLIGLNLRSGGYRIISVHGGSMGDTIPSGSLVIARWHAPDEVEVGDVILIQEGSDGVTATPKLHRIVSLDSADSVVTVETKGDANKTPDAVPYTLSGDVLVSEHHIPLLGRWISTLRTPAGWMLAIALPFTLAAGLIIFAIWKGDRRAAAAA